MKSDLLVQKEMAELVAEVSPASLISPGPLAGSIDGLSLVDQLDLGHDRWILILRDGSGSKWAAPVVTSENAIRRARPGDGVSEALLDFLAMGEGGSSGFTWQSWNVPTAIGEASIPVDQTHESVVVGHLAVVKWQAILSSSNSAPLTIQVLKEKKFGHMPELFALLQWQDLDQSETLAVLVASVVAYLPGSQDGWEWMVDDLTSYVEGSSTLASALAPLTALGEITAELHVTLAHDGNYELNPDFLNAWLVSALQDLDSVLEEIDGDELVRVGESREQIFEVLSLVEHIWETPLINIHGDLHVGQFLRGPGRHEFAVIDFDGNPVASETERSAAAPAASDVASLMQSIDHVGRIVQRKFGGVGHDLIEDWIEPAKQRFLEAYRDRLAENEMIELLDERLLFPFRVRQELREFLYAARHLPSWRYVPDTALAALLDERWRA
ncbi:MAG TPA: phosphotransferase [Candidatus Nanopelagicaceae bacterium]|nr:phosphotransferase [Candidatus Nanopelagicaceae bacterium]